MAALAADIETKYDPRWNIGLVQFNTAAADTYYRGGLAHVLDDGSGLTLTPVDADFYWGVVSEHKVCTAATDLVWCATSGRWFFTCSALILGDMNKAFAIKQAALFDNPADLNVQAAGDPGAIGYLYQIGTTGTDGWINTDHRMAPTNS